ncbi:amidase family protein [Acidobacteria bacterium AH-259-D05]|nr:amidase family protein [Acidobacteria bacterium AH-259-D05]
MKASLRTLFSSRLWQLTVLLAVVLLSLGSLASSSQTKRFDLLEATIEDIHDAYKSGQLTSRRLVQLYLDRIEAYDKNGPKINAIITVNPKALEEANKLDAAFKRSGPVGPLHGIPIILKDQIDAKGTPTTMGSVLFKDYYPDHDAFAVEKMKKAGAIILAKATLGELGGGDTYGSLYGATRNPYALDRTTGGSSGGPAATVAANFATVAVGQEGVASIRWPSTWNALVGMRPTAGLVSRSGVYNGWPAVNGSMGPMTRTVQDLAILLDILVGYDPEDPVTALGVGKVPDTYTKFLDSNGLKEARIGVLRQSIGRRSEPGTEDFLKVSVVFDRAIGELKAAGAVLVDPIAIPNVKELLAKRAWNPRNSEESLTVYLGRSANPPYKSRQEMLQSPEFTKLLAPTQRRVGGSRGPDAQLRYYEYLKARDDLMIHLLKVMADHQLDAIVHKSVEHQPPFLSQLTVPPYVGERGAPDINTYLVFVPTITVPAGFTEDNIPTGISFLGRPYSEGTLIKLAYSYEQANRHRRSPSSTPSLQGEP